MLALDPGTEQSGLVVYDGARVERAGVFDNGTLLEALRHGGELRERYCGEVLAVEMVACYGMPVGAEVFETVVWIGRFLEAWQPHPSERLYRRDVKLHLCESARAKDANVRAALIDRFGPGKRKAVGLKASPGPLYGVRSHAWAALAVAVVYCDQHDHPASVPRLRAWRL